MDTTTNQNLEQIITHEQVCTKMLELFGDKIANYEHHPKQFEYQIKLAKWMLQVTPTEISTCEST
jgi:hypothetical protein